MEQRNQLYAATRFSRCTRITVGVVRPFFRQASVCIPALFIFYFEEEKEQCRTLKDMRFMRR